MLGFTGKGRELREARDTIGVDLHRQIRTAFMANNALASDRLATSFTVGYILGFVRFGFYSLGTDGDRSLESHIRRICDGILPKKLYKILSNQRSALQIAQKMVDDGLGPEKMGFDPKEVVALFKRGLNAADYDVSVVGNDVLPPDNFRRYLQDEPLQS